MSSKNEHTGKFGGPGSSHQDRAHPGKNRQPSGHKDGGKRAATAPMPGEPRNTRDSRVSEGGGERDCHNTHTPKRS